MSQQTIKWASGNGWIVLSGDYDGSSEARAKVLERAIAGEGVAYISFASDQGDALIEDMEDLGAPSGYIVDPVHDDVESIYELLSRATVIVIQAGNSTDDLYYTLLGASVEALQQSLDSGSIILIEGVAASLFGRWYLSDDGQLVEGLNWIEDVFIIPGITSLADSKIAQMVLQAQPDLAAIGIGPGSAIAFGPDGQMEIWAKKEVTILLGSQYSAANGRVSNS